jgi:hypothetical protein
MSGFDVGGIDWTIRVQDEFTNPLNEFRRLANEVRTSINNSTSAAAERQFGRAMAAGARAAGPPVAQLTSQFKNFQNALNSGTAAGNRLVFTLRNIIGVGAGLAALQQVQGAFRGLVEAGIDFNKQLEDSTVGIAGLLNAVGKVTDAQGNLVTGQRAFNFTQSLAVGQVEKLRQATLRTTASFQELADTFQVAVAPGLKAGLNIDQIRELAISVSQAAGALSVPTNQLSEEIRALLTGTIQARTTRIATALGIRPEDIRKAQKDVDGLDKFLRQKFAAFAVAADRVAGTFSGTFKRAQTAINLAAGQAAKPLFEEVRQTFQEVFETFTTKDPFGNIIPDARAARVLREVFDGIAGAVKTIRENSRNISFDELLSAARALGDFFRGLGQVVVGFVTGAVQVVDVLGTAFRALTQGSNFIQLFTILGRIITLVGLVGAAFGTVHIIISTILLPLRTLNTTIQTVTASAALLANPWTVTLGVVAAVLFTAQEVARVQGEILRAKTAPSGDLNPEGKAIQAVTEAQKALTEEQTRFNEVQKRTTIEDKERFDATVKLEDATQKLHDAELDLVLVRRDKEKQKLGPAGDPVKPVVDQKTILSQAAAFARSLVGAIQGELDKTPVTPTIQRQPTLNLDKAGKFTDEAAALLGIFEEADKKLDDLRFKGNGETINKFKAALEQMADLTKQGVALMQSTISAFGSFIADTIVDAFDPSNDVSFKERFARFLQGIAKQIIATLVQIAIAEAVLKLGFQTVASEGGLVANRGGFVDAFADGGPVRGPNTHFSRPAGVPASDTVPAWLTPGEFVQKASAVARYGADAMSALNAGLLDPTAFRELAGLGQRRGQNFTRARRIAFADGGLVAQAQQAQQAATPGSSGGPTPAFIVGNDQAVDRFLRGGKAAFLDFARENASSLKAILGP